MQTKRDGSNNANNATISIVCNTTFNVLRIAIYISISFRQNKRLPMKGSRNVLGNFYNINTTNGFCGHRQRNIPATDCASLKPLCVLALGLSPRRLSWLTHASTEKVWRIPNSVGIEVPLTKAERIIALGQTVAIITYCLVTGCMASHTILLHPFTTQHNNGENGKDEHNT